MPVEIVMPRLSDTMEKGTIARWLKREGEEVKKGEPLADIETDKATMQLESYVSGRLSKILMSEGTTAPIGTPIAEITKDGEAPFVRAATTDQNAAPTAVPTGASQEETVAPPTKAKAMAIPTTTATSPVSPPSPSGAVRASPIARRMAEELDIDLSAVTGTGPGGRITREDVESAAQHAVPPVTPAAPAKTAEAHAEPSVLPSTRMQEAIAQRMALSKATVPHFYVTSEIDMGTAMTLREQLNRAWSSVHIGFTDIIVKATGLALRKHPLVNASWRNNRIELNKDVNVGIAVATDGGLLVPVLHAVDQMDLRTLSEELRALVQRTREGKAMAGDYDGGTFTVSNLGTYRVDEFAAIITPPESGILAVGRIERKPIVQDDHLAISERMRVTLSADHRVFYGAEAAAFLDDLVTLLENPLSLLK